jgi:hypothetical protein
VVKFPAATYTVETYLAIEMYFLSAISRTIHILTIRLNHLASISVITTCFPVTKNG